MKKEIVELTKKWYQIVGLDHHKDRDCHWHIEVCYKYGEQPTYSVNHAGYIYKDVYSDDFPTIEVAEKFLLDELKKAIRGEDKWADVVIRTPNEYDADQLSLAKEIKNITSLCLN